LLVGIGIYRVPAGVSGASWKKLVGEEEKQVVHSPKISSTWVQSITNICCLKIPLKIKNFSLK